MVHIGFSYKKGNPLSWLIRKVTGSTCSHAWVLIDDPYFGVPVVLQASLEGFTLTTYARFQADNTVVDVVTPVIPLDAALHQAWQALGEKYDYTGLLGMAWVLLGRALRRTWKNPLSHADEMFCSEAIVEQLLIPAGYPQVATLGGLPQDVSPQVLRTFLNAVKSAPTI
jgi:hypothetical protein